MSNPMMQPGQWSNGVQQPNYAQPLMDFSPLGKIGSTIAGQMQPKPQPSTVGQPMQITPGPGQGQPTRPPQQGGLPGGANAMASTADATPWASALMKMFGGQGMPGGGGMSMGNPGGTGGPMGFGSGNAIY
jgi:hypothetical protein